MIFLSSSRVYSIDKLRKLVKNNIIKKPLKNIKEIDENFYTSDPSSLYGFTKLASEKLIKEMFYKTNLKYIINRLGVITGPWQFGKQDQGFVTLWIAKHFFKKKLTYIGFGGNGNQIRDIIHIDDVCTIILQQIKKLKYINNNVFNIGGGKKNVISLRNLTKISQKITGNKILIGKQLKTSKFDIPAYVTNNSKIKKFYKWKPLKDIDDIAGDIYKWIYNNKKVWRLFK